MRQAGVQSGPSVGSRGTCNTSTMQYAAQLQLCAVRAVPSSAVNQTTALRGCGGGAACGASAAPAPAAAVVAQCAHVMDVPRTPPRQRVCFYCRSLVTSGRHLNLWLVFWFFIVRVHACIMYNYWHCIHIDLYLII